MSILSGVFFQPLCLWVGRLFSLRFSASQGLWCWCNRSGRILAASPSFVQAFGHNHELVLWHVLAPHVHHEDALARIKGHVSHFFERKKGHLSLTEVLPFLVSIMPQKWLRAFFVVIVEKELSHLKENRAMHIGHGDANKAPFLMFQVHVPSQEITYGNAPFQELQKQITLSAAGEGLPFGQDFRVFLEGLVSQDTAGRQTFVQTVLARKRAFNVCALPVQDKHVWCWAFEVSDHLDAQDLAEKQKRHTERLLRALPMGVGIFDTQRRLVSFNSAFSGMFRLDEQWLNNQPLWEEILDLFREKRLLPEVLDFASYKEQFLPLFSAMERPPHEEFIHLPNEGIVRMVLTPHPFSGCLVFFEDVTERLRLKRRRNELSTLLESVVNQSEEGVLIVLADQRVFLLNHTLQSLWLLGAETRSLKGENIFTLFSLVQDKFYSYAHRRFYRNMLTSFLEKRLTQTGFMLCKKNRVIKVCYAPLPDGEHMIRFSDVTSQLETIELKKESSRLLALERLIFSARLDNLVKSVEHQSVYEHDLVLQSEARKETKWVSSQFLTDAFKDLRKIFSGDLAILRDSFGFSDILDEVLSLFDGLLTEKRLRLQMMGAFDVWFVMNRVLFTQFLWRALGYVFQEAEPGALVTLRMTRSGRGVSMHISSQVATKETDSLSQRFDTFRPWFLGFGLLARFAAPVNCRLAIHSSHKDRLYFSCHFSKQSVEAFTTSAMQRAS